MSKVLTWFCFKGVLPKKDYELIDEHISFYKAGEPIVVLEKRHRFHLFGKSYITLILY